MQSMKNKGCDSISSCNNSSSNNNNNGDGNGNGEAQKQKERHIVSWSQEEDDILREQIGIHGTDNWAIVASKFKDKSTRQCRRRWFTYLNSDFKKGGWSQEEDMLLCEAQKIFGNRWTEIAKVVSGRTDNAVKNRFSTLCKKRAKNEALAKENNKFYIATNNKRTRLHNVHDSETLLEMSPSKIRRKHIPDATEDYRQLRPPFTLILQKCHNVNATTTQLRPKTDEVSKDGTFLKKDDPKIIALLQQAELLSSLAIKVNTEKTNESYEDACKAVQDFIKQSKGSDALGFNVSDMDVRSCDEGSQQSWRQLDLYQGSPDGSDYSTGSTVLSQAIEKMEPVQDNIVDGKSNIIPDSTTNEDILGSCDGFDNDVDVVCPLPNSEFNSPVQVTPMFKSMAAGIPSPHFSESERNFLLKTLGMETPPPKQNTKTAHPPCKRALLHCL
ncbi:putative transcription factor MYB family [Helianthus annuus]|uniref:Putative homeodomain-like, Myb-related protein B n=1 Tax=Helianthus annuus TaxID=4232 RepID=A0A251RVF2_HELAN|nr:transcription factor MYB124 [Helianthus annuus]XP_022025582.1 transcription factor MYB124 [Helianthus annuus]XP_022025583.1 transcription factor MYB124 [Helianthus annuus]XP_022025585.1 transcription factor MYB124 [Helianthus annuus]XP_022025586.1 transcription factor MYB124 [Helianthus annuus]XP_022025587.1 transcription factor MYB124 [Helianthus annuus]XP_022025589.1 transcription factor MYB124 [Helianthus annuus]XP_022025591.1 transcription factor MYB124 [Helianthus annuus]XP_03584235